MEVTSAAPIAWKLMRLLMGLEDDFVSDLELERQQNERKRELVAEILRLRKEKNRKRTKIMMMIGLFGSLDPLLRRAKWQILEARD